MWILKSVANGGTTLETWSYLGENMVSNENMLPGATVEKTTGLELWVANSDKEVKAHTAFASTTQFSMIDSIYSHTHNFFDGVKHKCKDKMRLA